jgi:penicillin amidase
VLPDAAPALDPPSVSSGGDGEVPNCTGWETGLAVEHASVSRYVFDLADWELSGWIVPLGASGDPASPHYSDQAEPWSRVQLFPMTYAWDRIEAESTQLVEPST